jgi:molecular chaperone GrpE
VKKEKNEEIVKDSNETLVDESEVVVKTEIESAKEEITKLENLVKEENIKYLKSLAELENYRKRSDEESKKKVDYAILNLLKDIIDPLDLLLGESEREVSDPQVKNYQTGFKMLGNMVLSKLKDKGLKVIDEIDVVFDSSIHEAFEKETDTSKKDNVVLKIIQKGYSFKGLLIRPAKITINKLEEKGENDNGNNK